MSGSIRSGVLALALLAWSAAAPAQILLVGNKSDDSVDLIDLASGDSFATVATGRAPHEIAVSPDGTTAVVTNYGDREQPGHSLTVIDIASARAVRTIDTSEHTRPHGIQFLDDRRVAVTAEGSAHLLIVDTATGEIASALETAQRISHMVAVALDGRRAFVANIGSGTVSVLDLSSGAKIADLEAGAGAEGIATTPGGDAVWVTNREADTLSVIDSQSLEVVAELPCPGFPIRVEFTPDGGRALVSAARSGEVVIYDVATRRPLARRQLDLTNAADAATRLFGDRFGASPVPVGIEVAPDGDRAWIAATQADVVVEVDTIDLRVLRVLRAGHEPDGMAYSPLAPPERR